MGFISANRKQQVLFGYSLDEFVPPDAKCRFIVDLTEQLNLSCLYRDYSDQGGDAYDPRMMLATWFFAYSEGVRSSRKLEEKCLRDMHFIFISGNLRPDHTSLSRFRQRHLALLPDLFVQIVRLAKDKGLSQFKTICIDGTRIKANASRALSVNSTGLDKLLEEVRSDIAEYLKECELADGDPGKRLDELRKIERKYEDRKRTLEERASKMWTRKNRENHRVNITDPEALSMKKVNGARGIPAYNGQASVDAESRLIVAAEAVDKGNDMGQFSEQHKQVEENIGEDPKRKYVADAGYHTINDLDYIEEKGIDAVIADPRKERRTGSATEVKMPPGDGKLKRSDFVFDREKDVYICPAGETIPFRQEWTDKRQLTYRIYGRSCNTCIHKHRCFKSRSGYYFKKVFRNVKEGLSEAMLEKATSEAGTKLMNTRFATSEPVFGNIKENLGFRNFHLRGLAGSRGEFLMMCIAHNVNRLFKLLGPAVDGITDPKCSISALKRLVHRFWHSLVPQLHLMWNDECRRTA